MDSENKIKIDDSRDALIDNGDSESDSDTAVNRDLKLDSNAARAVEINGGSESDSSSLETLEIDRDSGSDADATQGLDNTNRISKPESTSSKAIDSDADSDAAETFNNNNRTRDDSKSEGPTVESQLSPSSSPRSSSSASEDCFSLGITGAEAIQKDSWGASEPDQQQQIPAAPPPRVTFQIAGAPPLTQAMERPPSDKEQPQQVQESGYRIPSYVFARTKSTAPTEWSTASNESLFSLHMGNASFNRDQFFLQGKSGDLGGASNPFLDYNTKPSHSVQSSDNYDIGDFRAEAEARAAETMREVIRELSANNTPGSPKEPSAITRSNGENTKSFAFPVLATDGDKSMSIKVGMTPAEQQKQQPGTVKEEAPAESSKDSQIAPQNRLFSIPCFSCCRPSCF